MKGILRTLLLSAMITIAGTAFSQNKSDSTSVGKEIKKAGKATARTAKKAGKKVGEVGAKSAAKVKDKSLKEKGPNGETVYIDKYQKKYYVNKNAKRIYLN